MTLHLAVALDGHGWHPAAWRTSPADPAAIFTARYWTRLITEADSAELDFVTIEDTFGPPSDDPARVTGRLDAVLVAARVAPVTRHVGLVPVATTTHTEPFHLSTALATLDYVSRGRAGWQVRVSARPEEAALVGLRAPLPAEALFGEAADAVEVVRRLWDSWQDDAVVKDVATGRFVDRERLHYIDFAGEFFRVKGPSIVPRPPQGQPLVTALAHAPVAYEFAARSADLVFVTPSDAADAARIVAQVHAPRVFADLLVFLDDHGVAAHERRARLDDLAGAGWRSDAAVFAGSPEELADLLVDWAAAGIDGVRLRPAALPDDLEPITRLLVPLLRDRGVFRPRSGSLRRRLGLPDAVNRYTEGVRGA
jgi:alkanesulfonate monooxygenase SsuD/methylene tetrahydromethanopterin reductase-like flavin-dependent oxidoreductase (luciferase family)